MAPRAPTAGDWLRLFGLTACWGSAFLFNEVALAGLPPPFIVAGRIVLGGLLLYIYARASGTAMPQALADWTPIAVIALFGVIVPFFLTVWAQVHLPSATTAVLMSVMPLFVMILAHVFVPGERLSAAKLGGFIVGFSGVVLVIGPQAATGADAMTAIASLAALGAAFSYSATSIYSRLNARAEPLAMAAGMLLVAAVIAVPAAAVRGVPAGLELTLPALASVAVLGVFATGLASVLYFEVISGPGPTFLSLVNYMVPAWGVLLGVFVLGEQLTPWAFAGLGLVLCGIAISEFGHRWQLARRAAQTPSHAGPPSL
jgi:drug/metabolite transporter (DMT)-like permease